MSNTEQQIEQQIQAKGVNAPRVTPQDIDAKIKGIYYSNPLQGVNPETAMDEGTYQNLRCLTFCTIVLENGFTVTGESACASPENFDEAIGQEIAFKNAREKIWLLEGYLLKEKLNHQIKIQEKQITLGDVKNNIQHQREFFSDEENKHVVQLKLTDGAVVTELHSNKDHAVTLAYQSASDYLQNKTNHSCNNGNGSDLTPDLLELKNEDGVKSSEPQCSTQACADGSASCNGYQLDAKRDNAFLVAQLLSNNKISAELRKKAETKMDALLDQLI